MSCKKTLRDLDVTNKKVLVRVDYNVSRNEAGEIEDLFRVTETRETLEYLLSRQAGVILISHLDRPGGKPNPKYTLKPLVEPLKELTKHPVIFLNDCIGPEVSQVAKALKPGEILLLENLRFHSEEEKNDETFARFLASLADVFVEEAFGVVHRAHASTVGIPRFIPGVQGFLVEREISFLSHLLENPKRPYVAILGGAKCSEKLGTLKSLLPKIDLALVGGAMAFTFLKAQGFNIGNSRVEEKWISEVNLLMKNYPDKIILPVDVIAAPSMKEPENAKNMKLSAENNLKDWQGLDIGEATIRLFSDILNKTSPKTIFWNGPMGVFEIPQFAAGTLELAKTLGRCAEKGAVTVVGGGDSISALNHFHLAKVISHISTGGGASLEFLEGKILPGIAALQDAPCASLS